MFPLAFGIIRDEFPREKVAQGIGLISATFGIGGGVGLVASGLILDNLSYEWIFWIGLPMTILAAVLAYFFVPASPVRSPAKIDWGGAALLAAASSASSSASARATPWAGTRRRSSASSPSPRFSP